MSKPKRNINNPFYLNGERAMVSLGPLNESTHCPFKCAFCYVQDEFVSYAKLDINKIIDFLKINRNQYNIIYISGDTDSFAPPRTQQGLALLYEIVEKINCDVLFTTRTVFSDVDYEVLKEIINRQKRKKKMLYACVSITRLSDKNAYLEPEPIPTPIERLIVLKKLKKLEATTVLALRPFLPVVSTNEYIEIIDYINEYIDIVLGESFYFIRNGAVQKRVFRKGILKEYEKNITNKKMNFDINDAVWDVWNSEDYEKLVQKKCEELGIIFSMHSEDAIKKFSNNN